MKSTISSLNPADFLKMTSTRNSKIEVASNEMPKKLLDYDTNILAAELHPEVQYLKINKVTERDGKDVKSFEFVPDTSKGTTKLAYFNAGQYLSMVVKIGDITISRPYSISSSPEDALNGKYELTIKRVDGGLATNYILDNWKEGDEVASSGPLGTFSYEPIRDAKTVIGIAGGSGITPFKSMANAIIQGDEDFNLVLLYGSRDSKNILFKKEFDEIMKKTDKVKVIHVLSNEEKEGYEHGFITKELIEKYAPKGEYSIFLCGPQAMYTFVDKEIEKLNLRQKFIRHEVFGEYRNPEKDAKYPKDMKETTFKVKVTIRDEVKEITVNANDTLLNSMEKNGIFAPADCRSGLCGWCRSKLVSGKVYIPESVDHRRLADSDFGYIHPCATFPLSDCELIVPPVH